MIILHGSPREIELILKSMIELFKRAPQEFGGYILPGVYCPDDESACVSYFNLIYIHSRYDRLKARAACQLSINYYDEC